jgi:hypothetical protein
MKRQHRPLLEDLEARTLLATCHVTRLGDFGAGADIGGGDSRGDLRYCISRANAEPGPDVVAFSVTGTIKLTRPLPDLASDIDIQGPGAEELSVSRYTGGDYRIFTVRTGATVRIDGLTVTNGAGSGLLGLRAGGGIQNSGRLVLTNCFVAGNRVIGFSDTFGGGIYNDGDLTLMRTTVSDNLAFSEAATHLNWVFGGGVYNRGNLTVIDSQISNNIAQSLKNSDEGEFVLGGGIYSGGGSFSLYNSTVSGNQIVLASGSLGVGHGAGISSSSYLRMVNSTISQNTTSGLFAFTGGIRLWSGPAYITHSTIYGNSLNGISQYNAPRLFLRNSIVSSVTGHFRGDHNLIGVNPMLGPLADNGGPTQTMALLPGSPAIDAGDPNVTDPPPWDQRGPGFPRIVNGRIDIGAYEVQATGMPGANGARRGSPDPAVALTAHLHSVAWSGDHATMGNAAFTTPLFLSPVHGASRGAVLGPVLTPGDWSRAHHPAPFTGLLGVGLEPRVLPSAQASARTPIEESPGTARAPEPAINGGPITADAERPVNGPEDFALLALNGRIDIGAYEVVLLVTADWDDELETKA